MNEKVTSIPELFGSMVFTQEQMRQRLPARVYNAWQQCLVQGTSLDRSIADEIASAMKDWVIEKGGSGRWCPGGSPAGCPRRWPACAWPCPRTPGR